MGPTTQPLCSSKGWECLILLLRVPKLHSTHRLAEIMAWESFPGVPVALGQQKRPPVTVSPRPQLSPITAAKPADKRAARASSLRSATPAPSSTPSCQLLPTAFTPTEQKQEMQKLFQYKNHHPSQTSPALTKLSSGVSSGTPPGHSLRGLCLGLSQRCHAGLGTESQPFKN